MPASINWIIGELRWGKDHDKYGDPYTIGMNVLKVDHSSAAITLCTGILPHEARGEIMELLRAEGIKRVIWDRVRLDGTLHRTEFDIGDK